jgi:hypothetical protein
VVVNRGEEELGIAEGTLRCDAVGFEAALDMVQGWLRRDHAAAYAAVVRQARLAPGARSPTIRSPIRRGG